MYLFIFNEIKVSKKYPEPEVFVSRAGLNSLEDRFLPAGHIFDTPDLNA